MRALEFTPPLPPSLTPPTPHESIAGNVINPAGVFTASRLPPPASRLPPPASRLPPPASR